jgi:lipopolysaccharide assembly protein A
MRAIRFAFWALVALCLVVVGLANRGPVTLRALPEGLAARAGLSLEFALPLFVVIFIGVAVGLLIGFVWEWLREGRLRSAARSTAREVDALQREVGRLRTAQGTGADDVLALLDQPARR